jgi:sulfatase maturation enzyme AslB (radical SAM superfamily)
MSLRGSFCSSPWLHMRITNDGGMTYCRWSDKTNTQANIRDTSPTEFFQQHMSGIRASMLSGESPAGCIECHQMELRHKVSGRQKQLLKVGVRLDRFEKTLASSPWVNTFVDPNFTQLPQDWQIDLGNYCNSACVFCSPVSSSRLAAEWKKLGFIDQLPAPNWTDDPALVAKFVETLKQSAHVQYIHFIGGETVITPAFKIILSALVQAGLNRTATIGFTTNLVSWDDEVVELLTQFGGVNLGMSIEAFDAVNDYVRWPASLPQVQDTLARWQKLAKKHNWLVQFRITPTVLTIGKLLSVYDFAWHENISVESCNFLWQPEFMQPSVLPMSHRQQVIDQMTGWITAHSINTETIVNIRNPNMAQQQMVQDLQSYVNYLKNEADNSNRLPDLVTFLKKLEANRKNSITTYLPEYEELFRTAGY